MMVIRCAQIVVDCADPALLGKFWSAMTDAPWTLRSDHWVSVNTDPLLCFQQVPESKQVKNRLHLDWSVEDLDDATRTAVTLGGVVHHRFCDAYGEVVVMADPGGNEFCLVHP